MNVGMNTCPEPGLRHIRDVDRIRRMWLLVRQEVHTFEWAMSAHAHPFISLYLDTDATQLALNPTVSLQALP